MPPKPSKSGKRQKRDDEDYSDDSGDDDIQPIHFFVPGENINAAVLVEYISRHVDRTAKITSAPHPAVCYIVFGSYFQVADYLRIKQGQASVSSRRGRLMP